ncbi:MFS transporter [Pseudonocardia spinosispora]|uniref:MFS transporter n=1 Tax=Pseudonocardia spinosispora TaxID=103441 RepID=UPI0004077D17|nr:MFS transporter [Pseudonocardia spinosispora]
MTHQPEVRPPAAEAQHLAIDDATFSRFHLKVTAYSGGGMFCDGYMLGIIAPALAVYSTQHQVSALWTGLIGASALIGLFLGSITFGWLTDKVGRQTMYLADLLLFVGGSIVQAFVTDVAWLFAVRLLLGIAVGADYAISPTLLAEFAPRRHRGWMLSSLNVVWTAGYVVSFGVGYLLSDLGPDSWRWMLASSAIPALIVTLLRLGTPESPRWLVRNGRSDEALEIVRGYIDPNATIADLAHDEGDRSTYRDLFQRGHLGRVLFGGVFWCCQVVPYFALFTFLPTVLAALKIEGDLAQSVLVNVFLLLGAVAGMLLVDRMNRRPFVLGSFLLLAVVTTVLGLWTGASAFVVVGLFGVFAFVASGAQSLALVYPSEMFPTAVRASGVGVVTAFSRIGAAIGTFLLPVGVAALGIHATTLIAAGTLVLGLLVSAFWAPETRAVALGQHAQS